MLDKLKPSSAVVAQSESPVSPSSVLSSSSVTAVSKTVGWLREQLLDGGRRDRLLLMDCRPQEMFESSHVAAAISVSIPGLMLRRLKRGNLPVKSLLASGEDRERFCRRCRTDAVVLYDESSRDWNENVDGGSVLGLLLRRMKDEGYRAYYLEGEQAPASK